MCLGLDFLKRGNSNTKESSFPSGQGQGNCRLLEPGGIVELALGPHFQLHLLGGVTEIWRHHRTALITKEVFDGTTVIIQALLLLV